MSRSGFGFYLIVLLVLLPCLVFAETQGGASDSTELKSVSKLTFYQLTELPKITGKDLRSTNTYYAYEFLFSVPVKVVAQTNDGSKTLVINKIMVPESTSGVKFRDGEKFNIFITAPNEQPQFHAFNPAKNVLVWEQTEAAQTKTGAASVPEITLSDDVFITPALDSITLNVLGLTADVSKQTTGSGATAFASYSFPVAVKAKLTRRSSTFFEKMTSSGRDAYDAFKDVDVSIKKITFYAEGCGSLLPEKIVKGAKTTIPLNLAASKCKRKEVIIQTAEPLYPVTVTSPARLFVPAPYCDALSGPEFKGVTEVTKDAAGNAFAPSKFTFSWEYGGKRVLVPVYYKSYSNNKEGAWNKLPVLATKIVVNNPGNMPAYINKKNKEIDATLFLKDLCSHSGAAIEVTNAKGVKFELGKTDAEKSSFLLYQIEQKQVLQGAYVKTFKVTVGESELSARYELSEPAKAYVFILPKLYDEGAVAKLGFDAASIKKKYLPALANATVKCGANEQKLKDCSAKKTGAVYSNGVLYQNYASLAADKKLKTEVISWDYKSGNAAAPFYSGTYEVGVKLTDVEGEGARSVNAHGYVAEELINVNADSKAELAQAVLKFKALVPVWEYSYMILDKTASGNTLAFKVFKTEKLTDTATSSVDYANNELVASFDYSQPLVVGKLYVVGDGSEGKPKTTFLVTKAASGDKEGEFVLTVYRGEKSEETMLLKDRGQACDPKAHPSVEDYVNYCLQYWENIPTTQSAGSSTSITDYEAARKSCEDSFTWAEGILASAKRNNIEYNFGVKRGSGASASVQSVLPPIGNCMPIATESLKQGVSGDYRLSCIQKYASSSFVCAAVAQVKLGGKCSALVDPLSECVVARAGYANYCGSGTCKERALYVKPKKSTSTCEVSLNDGSISFGFPELVEAKVASVKTKYSLAYLKDSNGAKIAGSEQKTASWDWDPWGHLDIYDVTAFKQSHFEEGGSAVFEFRNSRNDVVYEAECKLSEEQLEDLFESHLNAAPSLGSCTAAIDMSSGNAAKNPENWKYEFKYVLPNNFAQKTGVNPKDLTRARVKITGVADRPIFLKLGKAGKSGFGCGSATSCSVDPWAVGWDDYALLRDLRNSAIKAKKPQTTRVTIYVIKPGYEDFSDYNEVYVAKASCDLSIARVPLDLKKP